MNVLTKKVIPLRSKKHTKHNQIPIKIYQDAEVASKTVADEIIKQIHLTSKTNKPFVLGLATGSTPIKVYQNLIKAYKIGQVSFKNVHTFNLDEYYPMPSNSIHSYVEFMNKNLFNHIDIPKEHIHIPDGTIAKEDIEEFCHNYELNIEKLGGIDIQLLGVGRTGHIGFNEPGSFANTDTRLVWLDAVTRKDAASSFFSERFVPKQAITMGIRTIMKSKQIFLLAWGEGKANIISSTIEGNVTDQIPATYLQNHENCIFILDQSSASELTIEKTPWLTGPCDWDKKLTKKAVIWVANECNKGILKLSEEDYLKNHLQSLLLTNVFDVCGINEKINHSLNQSFERWDMMKNELNQNESLNTIKPTQNVLVFSPHPDDDVISMGGTLIKMVEIGFEVHVAYQTSGNIAVFDDEVIRFLQFCLEVNPNDKTLIKKYKEIYRSLKNKKLGEIDSALVQDFKGNIRKGEALAACRVCGVKEDNAHFMHLPFYETGVVEKKPHSATDVQLTVELLNKLKPRKIFVAGDLSDPHGTHRVCLQIIFDALDSLIKDNVKWIKNTEIWLYRGAWQEWGVDEIEMAVPLNPKKVLQKREAIFKHQSQKDRAMFPGPDSREFWQRAEQRNQETANHYNLLGLPEHEAVEGFVRYYPSM